MCYGTSHLRTAHPIRGQQLVSRIIIVKVRKRKNHGVTPWKECSHKRGGVVKGAGRFFCHCFLSTEQGRWAKRLPEADKFRKETGLQILHAAARGVPGEPFRASGLLRGSMAIRMCPSKMSRSRHAAARTAGGAGVSGSRPDAVRQGFMAFRPTSTATRMRRTAPSCSSSARGDNTKGHPDAPMFGESVAERPESE